MYTVEDEALRKAAAAGAARAAARAAAVGGDGGSAGEGGKEGDSFVEDEYNTLQRFPPFRRRQTRKEEEEGGGGEIGAAAEQEGEEAMISRALGAVLGSVVGDAAAMGVHWIYAPEELRKLWEARRDEQSKKKKEEEQQKEDEEVRKKEKEEEKLQQTEDQITAAPAPAPAPLITTLKNIESEIGLEFYQPPRSPFFSYPHGRPSPYGEQTLLLLRSLHHDLGLRPSLYARAYAEQYGEGWEGYRDASTKGFLRRWYEEGGGRVAGARDWQANCFARLPPLVVGFGGGQEGVREGAGGGERVMLRAVEHATRVTQDDDRAVAWGRGAAGVLSRIVFKKQTIEMAIREVVVALRDPQTPLGEEEGRREGGREGLQEEGAREEGGREGGKEGGLDLARAFEQVLFLGVEEEMRKDVCETVARLGKNCHLPNSLQTALHAALFYTHGVSFSTKSSSLPPSLPSSLAPAAVTAQQQQQQQQREEKQQLFKRAIRAAIREGGCCASRAGWVGACLGGWMGIECVPEEWRREVSGFDRIKEEVEEIVRQRRRKAQ